MVSHSIFTGRICDQSCGEWRHIHRHTLQRRRRAGRGKDHKQQTIEARSEQADIDSRPELWRCMSAQLSCLRASYS